MGIRLFLVKYKLTEEFIKKQSLLFDPHTHKVFHSIYPQELSIYAKDMAFERALKSAQNAHMRTKSVVFCPECSFLAYKHVYLYTNK